MKGGRIILAGRAADHRIENVYFNGCVNAGTPVDGPEDVATNAHVTRVHFNQSVPAKPAVPAGRYEAESMESATNTKPQVTYADAEMSNGKGRLLKAGAAGDYVAYSLEVPTAGVYRVVVRVKRTAASGKFQLSRICSRAPPIIARSTWEK